MRLNQVTAPAADLDQSIAFYRTLGLRLIVQSPHYARFEMPDGDATFSLHAVHGRAAQERAPQLYFECDDLEAEIERLKQAGVEFEADLKTQPWLWSEAWLRDPAGNHLCLFQAGEMRRNPPWRIADGSV